MRSYLSTQRIPLATFVQARAREARHAPTETEAALFRELRGRRLGVSFRRQVPIGRYIVDFLAPEVRLVVEVDGEYHARRKSRDATRDAWLGRQGYTVLRIDAEVVRRELRVAVGRVREAVDALRRR
jgi:very-short-patch-repair endonuclease